MTVIVSTPPDLKRTYPHVDDIQDWRAQQTVRLLWDRIFALEARLQASETTVGDLVSESNRLDDAVTLADRKADEALALAQRRPGEAVIPGGSPGSGDPPPVVVDLVWSWTDRGGHPVVAPDGSVDPPVTLDEWREYFYGLLGKTIGEPANDYEVWLQGLIDNGMLVNAEPGVVPEATWPYFGIHVIVDAAGHPRGRIQLPTAIDTVGDGSGYFTHEFQVIADA